ncbi:DUF4422 domain-containing protein [Lactobacillus sp. UCMA15818]|uniref:DUF4422 domain-containing protein n=1 Tax=Lactobacillaceae TaxID=33958 RepID=UPI0025AFDA09|nr:DUF4422 domain-containing protein [Lactobacillus sp. UCMA15818]MDN2453299.1 DUF4422 domain-containing protein [Lactobacillus sp. UCMA15818]
MKTEIYVVSHKNVKMPDENVYVPVQVGKNPENFKGFERDNTGVNISAKNPNYCELTVQYWAWKNRVADVKGLVHYRRYFSDGRKAFFKTPAEKFNEILKSDKIASLLQENDAILPHKRNYYIETSWSHYAHAHHIEGLELAKDVIGERYPDYIPSFEAVVDRRAVHMFNMVIAKSEVFDNYTEWLFEILPEVEKRVNISEYSDYEKRIFGFISEILLDVWFEKNQIKYTELPVLFIGKQNWFRKVSLFFLRKMGLSKKSV